MEPPILIVIQPKNGATYTELEQDTLIVGFKLAHGQHFEEPHFVKLVSIFGLRQQVLVSLSFATPQFVDSGLKQVVGTSLGGNTYVPLTGPWLQVTGEIRLTPLASQAKFKDASVSDKLTIVFHIVSATWLGSNGSSGEASH